MPLIINNTRVNKISGPVSMYILKPKPDQPIFKCLPIYILFGDMHHGIENLCEEDKSPETMDVGSIQFLSLLNQLSSPLQPIDFFVEGPDLHNQTQRNPLNSPYPLDKISKLYTECYNSTYSSKRKLIGYYNPESDCKQIDNIRWHSGDPRQFTERKYEQPFVTGCNYSSLFNNIIRSIPNATNVNQFRQIINSVILNFIQTHNRDCFAMLSTNNLFSENYKTKLTRQIVDRNSLIMKQIRSFNDPVREQIIIYMEKYIDYCFDKYKEMYQSESTRDILNKIHVLMMNILSPDITSEDKVHYVDELYAIYLRQGIVRLTTYLGNIFSIELLILDLYTFCRSLKYSKNILPTIQDPLPIINICYFGNNHVRNMVHLLRHITSMYTLEYGHIPRFGSNIISNPIYMRCLEIDQQVNIDTMIRDLKYERMKIYITKRKEENIMDRKRKSLENKISENRRSREESTRRQRLRHRKTIPMEY
jgi:hypothetical protein